MAMVDAVAKWAAEGVLREPELLVRRSIATLIGVTDYGRVRSGRGEWEPAQLTCDWREGVLRGGEATSDDVGDDEHSGRNHMLFDLVRAGITTGESGVEARWTRIRSLLLKGVGARARPSGYSAMLQTIGASRVNWKLDQCVCGTAHDVIS